MLKLAKFWARRIAETLHYDTEKEAVVAYGLIAMIQIVITVLLVLLLGLLVHAPIEALTVCFSGSLLRKYSGGAHASTPERCTAISVVYCTVSGFVSRFFATSYYDFWIAGILALVLFGISYLLVFRFAPVDSPNKPIRTEKKRAQMRKGSFAVLAVYFLVCLLFWALGARSSALRACGIAILFGTGWQVFTLTTFGSKFLGIINRGFQCRREG